MDTQAKGWPYLVLQYFIVSHKADDKAWLTSTMGYQENQF